MNIVVTGASRGIGRAITARLETRGHNVWSLSRAAKCDVSDWNQIKAAATLVAEAWTHVDGLVCCAGIQGEIGRAMASDPQKWSDTIRTNLDGTYFTIRAFAALLGKAQHPKVVCFSGGGSTKARRNFSAYGSAKTAIVRLVETIAEEEGHAMDINAIAPGAINTRMLEEVLALGPAVVGGQEYATAQKQQASGGGSVETAVDLVEWLISRASDGVSGRLISAPWDPWKTLAEHAAELADSDIFTLRRVVPAERGKTWDKK